VFGDDQVQNDLLGLEYGSRDLGRPNITEQGMVSGVRG